MSDKRFYWIKLKTDFFDLPTIDWLQDQKNGCEYIVLYQKLCLMASNTGGILVRKVGEMIIPYDVKKISEVTRFKYDTVIVAMELYKKIGLIFEQNDGVFQIANFESMVGSESKWAEKKRLQRDNKEDKVPKLPSQKKDKQEDKSEDNVQNSSANMSANMSDNSPRTLSDKRLEYRDKSIDKDIRTTTTTTSAGEEILQMDEETPVFKKYSDNIHPISGSIEVDALTDLIRTHTAVWVGKAIDEAVAANVRNLKYITAILARWKTTGLCEPWAEKRESNGQRSSASNKSTSRKGKKSETDWSQESNGW